MSSTSPQILFILGPTASGKSRIALDLASSYQGEIISCDSMQIYQGMPIGTAQPTYQEQEMVSHHLINCFDISTYWDANLFVEATKRIIPTITQRQHFPIIVGGTGMYARSLAYQMPLQPSDKELFSQICLEYEQGGEVALQQELINSGSDFHPDILKNWRRLVRAIEILRLTGHPPISNHKISPLPGMIQWIIIPEWNWLKARIASRTQEMTKMGWIDEARELQKQGLLATPTARQALGYAEIINWLEQDGKDLDSLTRILTTKTYQYARRQKTWFKKQHPGSEIFEPQNQQEWLLLEKYLGERFNRLREKQ